MKVAPSFARARSVLADAEAAVLEARRALIRAALRLHRGNRSAAAAKLGWNRATLHRAITALEMVAELDEMAQAEGWLDGDAGAARALRGKTQARGRQPPRP